MFLMKGEDKTSIGCRMLCCCVLYKAKILQKQRRSTQQGALLELISSIKYSPKHLEKQFETRSMLTLWTRSPNNIFTTREHEWRHRVGRNFCTSPVYEAVVSILQSPFFGARRYQMPNGTRNTWQINISQLWNIFFHKHTQKHKRALSLLSQWRIHYLRKKTIDS